MPNNHSLSAEHRRHDRLLVARFAVGDAGFGQDHEARDLVRRCSECAALAADISAISGTVAKLPVAPRPRDFRLTTEQAAQLRGSGLERWLRTITGSGWATLRPVAAVALSIGLVMSLVGVLPILGVAAPGALDTSRSEIGALPSASSATQTGDRSAIDQPSPGNDTAQPGGMNAFTSPEPPANNNINNPYVQPTPALQPGPGESADLQKSAPGAVGLGLPQLVLLIGLALTTVALAVLVLLYAARQRFYDPLLR